MLVTSQGLWIIHASQCNNSDVTDIGTYGQTLTFERHSVVGRYMFVVGTVWLHANI